MSNSKPSPDHAKPLGLDLDQAFKTVMKEALQDEVPDIIRHQDFQLTWADVRERLADEIATGSYFPKHAEIVEVPKSTLATRPMAVLHLEDRIVYQAILDRMAKPIDDQLQSEVHSSRLYADKRGRWRTKRPIDAWVGFQEVGRELCDRYQEVCMLTTDITSYFEFIDIGLLIQDLRDLMTLEPEHIDLLHRLLDGLNNGDVNGVPQGPEASSFLGNLYLRSLDSQLRKLEVRFVRYQDDIKVFADRPHELRLAVLELTPIIRRRHLNLSTSKTKILRGDEVRRHFEDSDKDAINYKIDVGDNTALDDLRALFDAAIARPQPNERDIRFTIYRLGKAGDQHAVGWILRNLDTVPYLAAILVRYLSQFVGERSDILAEVRAFLDDPARNISPIVEMHLMRMVAACSKIDEETYSCVWQMLSNPSKDNLVRQFASRAVGRHLRDGRAGDLELMRGFVERLAKDDSLRRALIVGLYEAGATDKRYLDAIAKGHPALSALCRYLRAKPILPPP